jgi:hypothetical protein
MPREPWRDDPEYVSIWRAARQDTADVAGYFVLADWLEERGHQPAAWLARLHGLTGRQPSVDPCTGEAWVGAMPLGYFSWHRLLAASPPDGLTLVFKRDVQAYQYLCRFKGPTGLAMGKGDWSSPAERRFLLSIPRLEALTCELIGLADWDWLTANLIRLTHLIAENPLIDPPALGMLKRLPALRAVHLRGNVSRDLSAAHGLTALRHLSLRGSWIEAATAHALVPAAESLTLDIANLGGQPRWPGLRSLRHNDGEGGPPLQPDELEALAAYPALERLGVRCRGVKPDTLKALAEAPCLRYLTLRFPEGEAVPSLTPLARAPALESLSVHGAMTDRHLAEAAGIAQLRDLALHGVRAGARGLAALAGLHRLERLVLSGECAAGVTPLAAASLPLLESLNLSSLTMHADAAAALQAACPPWVRCFVPETENE